MCTDPDGASCFPLHGLAPHFHKPDRIEFDLTPVNGFTPDADDPTQGVHWCPHCGDGRPLDRLKPRLSRRFGIWQCRLPFSPVAGYGYTPAEAWAEWLAIRGGR
jgi:hypothetical protein